MDEAQSQNNPGFQRQNPANAPLSPRSGAPSVGTIDTVGVSPRVSPRVSHRQSRRYTRFVGWAKLVLPLSAGALLAALAAWPYITTNLAFLRTGLPHLDASRARDLRMVNPRYLGIDKEGRPFTVTADAARQNNPNGTDISSQSGDLVALDVPKADLLSKSNSWIIVTGSTGIYQPQAHVLDLFGDVTVFHEKGFTFHTRSARIGLDAGTADGKEAITGNGPSATIEAQGFHLVDKGDKISFTGKSHLILRTAHAHEPKQVVPVEPAPARAKAQAKPGAKPGTKNPATTAPPKNQPPIKTQPVTGTR